jgi:hypothetical protein
VSGGLVAPATRRHRSHTAPFRSPPSPFLFAPASRPPQEAKTLGVFTQQQALEFMAAKLTQKGPPRAFTERRRKSKVGGGGAGGWAGARCWQRRR